MGRATGRACHRQRGARAPERTRRRQAGAAASRRARACGCLAALGAASDALCQEGGLQWSGGITVVGLYADDARIEHDETLSADLFLTLDHARGRWLVYLEGNSTLDARAASTLIPESNADAATAIDADGGGRIQVSEINYRFLTESGRALTVGLVDATAYLDRTRITNDENVQFLGVSFVNNPTIEFPDYTVGLVFERPGDGRVPQVNAVLTSANGLAENPELSYRHVLRVGEEEDGVFAALGLGWLSQRHLVRTGAWVNTKPHRALAGGSTGKDNYGAYVVYGHSRDPHGLSFRAGVASDEVSRAAAFLALAYRYRWRQHALGVGVGHTFLSRDVDSGELDDSTHLEVYGRFTIGGRIHLTASLQRVLHSDFVAPESDPRESVSLAGLRFHYDF